MKVGISLTVLLALASVAQAGEVAGESPRRMVFEFKLGPYTPLVDRRFAEKAGPYFLVFNNAPMLLGEGVLEYQFFQSFGSAAAGISAGYAEKYAPSLDAITGATLSQKTGLKLIPLKAYLSYRFDWLSLKKDFPLVPYAKVGVVALNWTSVNGSGVELVDGERGTGMKYGYMGVVGLALTMDFLDPRLSRDFDTGMGVNHTYLFGEYTVQEVNNVGTQLARDLDFSSRHWLFGLAFEF